MEKRRAEFLGGSPGGQLLLSEIDKKSVHMVEREAAKLVNGGIAFLEQLHLKVRGETEGILRLVESKGGWGGWGDSNPRLFFCWMQ